MSLLMPEYERQLRAAARRLARDAAAAKPSRGRLGSWLLLGLAGAVTVAVAAVALVLVGHRGSPANSGLAGALPATQYDCSPHQILRAKGRLAPIAHGTVAAERWTLDVDSARRGLRSVQAGRLVLGGRAYGFCEVKQDGGPNGGPVEVELVNAGPQGIVYGIAASPDRPPIVIEAATARGTAVHPVPSHQYPATTYQVPGAKLFLRVLPASACAYPDLAMTAAEAPEHTGPRHEAPGRITQTAAGGSVIVFTGPYSQSCAPGQLRQSVPIKTYREPSSSMQPTLTIGQRVSVAVDPRYTPRVGDIVAFHPPAGADAVSPLCGAYAEGTGHAQVCAVPTPRESQLTFLKRVVAGPRDTIRLVNGHVIRNGKQENDSHYALACGGGPSCTFPKPVSIPPGDYFLLGDNRGASDDSRFWGPVPRTWIIGKVTQIWPRR